MIRRTSIETYHRIQDEGLLGRLQFAVYEVLYAHGPLTQNELHRYHFPNTQPRNIQPRVSELVHFGVVQCFGERECKITGRFCMVWDVTDQLPIKLPKPKTKGQIIKEQAERIRHLEAEIGRLRMPHPVTWEGNQARLL